MDSNEEFRFEVPIISHVISKCEPRELPNVDNDCLVIEAGDTLENVSNTQNVGSEPMRCPESNANIAQDCANEPSINLEDSQSEDCTIVECTFLNKPNIDSVDDIYKENELFADLIEKCINLENSQGMLRIVKKTLIPIFKDTDPVYRKSEEFNKILLQYIRKLDTEPERKFSHIKNVCEALKLNIKKKEKAKKRVSLVTLQTNKNGKYPSKKSRISTKTKSTMSKNACSVNNNLPINCDSDSDDNVGPVQESVVQIDSDNDSPVRIVSDDDDDIIPIDDEIDNTNKENSNINAQVNGNEISQKVPDIAVSKMPVNLSNEDDEIVNSNKVFNPGEATEPAYHEVIKINLDRETAIKNLERQIEIYNKMVAQLEEEEVYHDGTSSPYIQSEVYKEKIVKLYKEICELTGTEAVKRHEVRLKVAAGREEGPVRCLEEFINSNIDGNGNPPFPDMLDVVQCVCKANVQYNLNWNQKQIMEEAKALFIYYGRAMQKRRQRREWKDLLKYVKEEIPDPADVDPELEAKLAENNRIGRKREQDLLDRYCAMENFGTRSTGVVDEDESNDESDEGSSRIAPNADNHVNNGVSNVVNLNPYDKSCRGQLTNNVTLHVANPFNGVSNGISSNIVVLPNSSMSNGMDILNLPPQLALPNCMGTVTLTDSQNIDKPNNGPIIQMFVVAPMNGANNLGLNNGSNFLIGSDVNITTGLPNTGTLIVNPNNSVLNRPNSSKVFNFRNDDLSDGVSITDNIVSNQNINQTSNSLQNTESSRENTLLVDSPNISNTTVLIDQDNENELQTDMGIKKEPADISRLLEELGDNFTATIGNILDPFEVIDISDSSESDSEGEYL